MVTFAFDKTARRFDVDGRLHVARSNISKATVNPYLGREIPNWEALGLQPDRIYKLLRDPEELKRAAATSNNIPLLDTHVPVSPDDPKQESVVGSTGTDASYEHPYLINSLVVWTDWSIEGVESREQCELSCSYRYRPDMTPGIYEGLHFDGVMRDIQFNHVALVTEGRAGPDVLVADSRLEMPSMPLKSRKALMVRGALAAVLRPALAADAKVDLDAVLAGVNQANYVASKPTILKRLEKATKDKLMGAVAFDAVLNAMDAETCAKDSDEDDDDKAKDADPSEEAAEHEDDPPSGAEKRGKAGAGGAADEEDPDMEKAEGKAKDKRAKDKRAKDEDPEAGKAMDAAMRRVAAQARKDAIAEVGRIAEARDLVKPHVGEIAVAMDSGAAILRLALDAADVETDGSESYTTLKSMVGLLPKPSATPKVTHAMDAAAADSFSKRFPAADRLRHA